MYRMLYIQFQRIDKHTSKLQGKPIGWFCGLFFGDNFHRCVCPICPVSITPLPDWRSILGLKSRETLTFSNQQAYPCQKKCDNPEFWKLTALLKITEKDQTFKESSPSAKAKRNSTLLGRKVIFLQGQSSLGIRRVGGD